MTQITSYPPGHTSYVLLKRVRMALPLCQLDVLTSPRTGAVTAIMTNPIWVVKVRMFTTQPNDPTAYRSLLRECTNRC